MKILTHKPKDSTATRPKMRICKIEDVKTEMRTNVLIEIYSYVKGYKKDYRKKMMREEEVDKYLKKHFYK